VDAPGGKAHFQAKDICYPLKRFHTYVRLAAVFEGIEGCATDPRLPRQLR